MIPNHPRDGISDLKEVLCMLDKGGIISMHALRVRKGWRGGSESRFLGGMLYIITDGEQWYGGRCSGHEANSVCSVVSLVYVPFI
jgi:hypothetical protein